MKINKPNVFKHLVDYVEDEKSEKEYTVEIEECISKQWVIEAATKEDALRKAESYYWDGDLVLDGDSEVLYRTKRICSPHNECTLKIKF